MAIEAVKIPQNVQVEDRIIGPITLRQIMIMMMSMGVSYALWAVMRASGYTGVMYTALAWIPTVIGAAFSFVKINGISMLRITLLSIERIKKPATRRWTPHRGIYVNIVTTLVAPDRENPEIAKKRENKKQTQLQELSHLLDKGPEELQAAAEPIARETPVIAREEDEPAANRLPVNPARIQAETRSAPASLDGISPAPAVKPEPAQGLMRDILPPMSHA